MNKATKARAAALLIAGAVGGGVLAGTLSATAATGTTTTTAPSATSTRPAPPAGAPNGRGPMGPGGASPVRSDEKLVTGDQLTTLKAAAVKAVPGGSIIRVETDSGDATYEAHMKKADGSLVTVKFGKDLRVTSVEEGMGK